MSRSVVLLPQSAAAMWTGASGELSGESASIFVSLSEWENATLVSVLTESSVLLIHAFPMATRYMMRYVGICCGGEVERKQR